MAHALPDGRIPVLLSAHEAELVGRDAAAIADYVRRCAEPDEITTAVAWTLLRTRRLRRHRAVVRAADRAELVAGLRALAAGDEHPLVARSAATAAPRTAFVFPGQGNQWPSMGADAYQRLPAYRGEADRCAQAFTAAALPSPLRYLLSSAEQEWSQIDIQGAQFTHAVSLAQVWRSCGVLPDMTVGHSLGEVAAAYVAGTITLPDAVAVIAARAAVVNRLPGRYGMAVLGVGGDDAERFIAETPGWLEISVVNSASSTVVSGDRDAVGAIVQRAERDGVFVRKLDVDFPAHTSALESVRGALRDLVPAAAFLDAPVEFVGSARGGVVPAGTDFADYWYDNLRTTVRFDQAVTAAVARGAGVFVELSAHPALLYALSELIDDAVIVGSGRRDEPVVDYLSANITATAVANPGYRWADVTEASPHQPLAGFPNAPMRAIHLWAQPEPLPPVPGSALTFAVEQWQPVAEPRLSATKASPRTVAIIGSDDLLVRQLTNAIAAHHGCQLVANDDAEIAVLIAPALLHANPRAAADQIIRGAGQLDYRRAVGPRCRRVWLVTTRGEQVSFDQSAGLPAQAALAAMHRSIGFEFPDHTFAHLDLPRRDIDAKNALKCVEALLGNATEIAIRHSATGLVGYTRTLHEPRKPVDEYPLDAAVLDDVIITGGSGTIGMRYAKYCIDNGARRVILLSRNGLDPDTLAQLTDRHTVDLHAPRCDITDPGAVAAVAAEYAGAGASLLIHAAGAARFGQHDQLRDVELADVFDAKITGLAHMVDRWPLRRDCRILLCSSVSGVWGGYGHAAYAAANRMLDVFAAQLQITGLRCTAVRWGLWQGTGIADAEIGRIERSGLVAIDPDAAVSAGLHHYAGDPLIFAADFDRLRLFFESQGIAALFTTPTAINTADAAADGECCGERSVAEVVPAELAAVLTLDGPASVDLSAALIDLGIDSLLALDLRKRLRRSTGRSVPLARLLGGITGTELIDVLQSNPGVETPESLESSRD